MVIEFFVVNTLFCILSIFENPYIYIIIKKNINYNKISNN
jgi:hypothetical protein